MSHCQITLSVNAGVALHLGAMRVWSDALHDRRVVGFSTVTPERWNILQAHPDFASPDLLFFTHCHPDHYSPRPDRAGDCPKSAGGPGAAGAGV